MDLYQSLSNTRKYNRMRDRLVDLSRQYNLDEIVRLEKIGFRHPIPEEPVALRSGKWAVGVALTDAELNEHIRRIIRQLDIRLPPDAAEDFVVGASWDGCGDDEDEGRETRSFDNVEDMMDFYQRMEREGRNPEHHNVHGPRAWEITYDSVEGEDE